MSRDLLLISQFCQKCEYFDDCPVLTPEPDYAEVFNECEFVQGVRSA